MTNKETVRLRDLAIGYEGRGGRSLVMSGITASIWSGELTCLLGSNGVGKSTLLRTLSAFQPALGGEILFNAQSTMQRSASPQEVSRGSSKNVQWTSLVNLSDRELSRTMGVVLTEKPDVRNMTVRELVAMGRAPYTGFWGSLDTDDWRIVDEAIDSVGIGTLKDRLVHTLSDGERQKTMVGKALAQQTPVILLDEPTAFLDYPSKVEMMQLLRRLARETQRTIFLSTHDLELALQLADRLWLMESEGLRIGTPHELADEGAFAHFVERPGIVFDSETMTIRAEISN